MTSPDFTMKEMLERQYSEIQSLHVKMDRVELQTTKTNGRVNAIEPEVETLRKQFYWVIGGLVSTLGLIGLYLIQKAMENGVFL